MPYKCATLKIPENYDARCKLTRIERDEIKELYGTISQRKLAKIYGVSRRLITFIGDPEKHAENLRRRDERGGSAAYYDRKTHTMAMMKHRRRKQKLYKSGFLKENN